jgi:hypothetical protein
MRLTALRPRDRLAVLGCALSLLGVTLGAGVSHAGAPQGGPRLSVDVARGRHAISPDIYGVNFAATGSARSLGLTLDRWGGNSTTRYDYQTGVHNTGSDWYFENIPPQSTTIKPHDAMIKADRGAGLRTILTVPLIGWTPKAGSPSKHPYACGFPRSAFANQDSFDPYDAHCGNGQHNGKNVSGNDPTVTSKAIGPAWVKAWVQALRTSYGSAAHGGVAYIEMDNEPSLWDSTQRDVHPHPLTYQELLSRTESYAAAVKSADASVKVIGPSDWGWCAYLFSAADPGHCSTGADRQAHGGMALVPWYLRQLRAWQAQHGKRLLDVLDEHYYPQADGVSLAPAGDAATQALRLRTTRSLWDPTYTDESWISDTAPGGVAVALIPRLRGWVAAEYPGTRLGISEYDFGGLESLNGALAQADVLGIFGREGLSLATLWGAGPADQPWAYAFRMFRDSDGHGARFGSTSVQALSFDPAQADRANGGQDALSIYAAQRPDGTLTVMVINKTAQALTSDLTLTGFTPAAAAQVWRYSAADLSGIQHLADVAVGGQTLTATYSASSITLLVLSPA